MRLATASGAPLPNTSKAAAERHRPSAAGRGIPGSSDRVGRCAQHSQERRAHCRTRRRSGFAPLLGQKHRGTWPLRLPRRTTKKALPGKAARKRVQPKASLETQVSPLLKYHVINAPRSADFAPTPSASKKCEEKWKRPSTGTSRPLPSVPTPRTPFTGAHGKETVRQSIFFRALTRPDKSRPGARVHARLGRQACGATLRPEGAPRGANGAQGRSQTHA